MSENLEQAMQEYRAIRDRLQGKKPAPRGRIWRRHLPAPLVKVVEVAEAHPRTALALGVVGILGPGLVSLTLLHGGIAIVESLLPLHGTPGSQLPGAQFAERAFQVVQHVYLPILSGVVLLGIGVRWLFRR